jgi:hypothetical protein
MQNCHSTRCLVFALLVFFSACGREGPPEPTNIDSSCEAPGVRAVVLSVGERMKLVSLLAPDSVLVREIRDAYEPYVTPELLHTWLSDPSRAPGQQGSSPWPERIDIQSVEATGPGVCRVEGEVVYMTSTEAGTGEAFSRMPVTVHVTNGDEWLIDSFEQSGSPPDASSAAPDM